MGLAHRGRSGRILEILGVIRVIRKPSERNYELWTMDYELKK